MRRIASKGALLIALCSFLVAPVATTANASETKGPGVSSRQLGNGLEVVVIPDRRAPVVTHMIWYKVGA